MYLNDQIIRFGIYGERSGVTTAPVSSSIPACAESNKEKKRKCDEFQCFIPYQIYVLSPQNSNDEEFFD